MRCLTRLGLSRSRFDRPLAVALALPGCPMPLHGGRGGPSRHLAARQVYGGPARRPGRKEGGGRLAALTPCRQFALWAPTMAGDWCCWALAIVLENASRIWFWAWRWRPHHVVMPSCLPAGRRDGRGAAGAELCHKRQAGPWRTFQPQVCHMPATIQRLTSISNLCCPVRGRLAARQHCSLEVVLPAAWTPGRALRERLDGIHAVRDSGRRPIHQACRDGSVGRALRSQCQGHGFIPRFHSTDLCYARVVWDHKVGLVIGVRSSDAQKRLPAQGRRCRPSQRRWPKMP